MCTHVAINREPLFIQSLLYIVHAVSNNYLKINILDSKPFLCASATSFFVSLSRHWMDTVLYYQDQPFTHQGWKRKHHVPLARIPWFSTWDTVRPNASLVYMHDGYLITNKIIHVLRDMFHDVVQDRKLRCIRRDQACKDVESFFFSIFVEQCTLTRHLALMNLLEEKTCVLWMTLQWGSEEGWKRTSCDVVRCRYVWWSSGRLEDLYIIRTSWGATLTNQ